MVGYLVEVGCNFKDDNLINVAVYVYLSCYIFGIAFVWFILSYSSATEIGIGISKTKFFPLRNCCNISSNEISMSITLWFGIHSKLCDIMYWFLTYLL